MPDHGADILTLAEQGGAVREQVTSERSQPSVSEIAI
jgi:hypothetical protein